MQVKGMIRVHAKTYRIVKVRSATYTVIRVLDDACIGSFGTLPRLRVEARRVEDQPLLIEIAVTALRQAAVSWSHLPRY